MDPLFKDVLVRLVGWKATVFHGDALVYDRWKWLRQHITPGNLRTLDAGCGSGCFSFFAAALGNDVVGIDKSKKDIESAVRRTRLLKGQKLQFLERDLCQLDDIASELGEFDQVLCFDLLEQIQTDQKLLEDLANRLRPGGRLILTTPFKFYNPMVGDSVSTGKVRWGYTHEEIRSLLMRSGLKVVVQDHIGGVISQQSTNALRLLSRVNSRIAWGLTFPLRLLRPLDPTVTKLMQYPFLSLGVVAVKK